MYICAPSKILPMKSRNNSIKQIFPNALSLRDFLTRVCSCSWDTVVDYSEKSTLRTLVNQLLVVPNDSEDLLESWAELVDPCNIATVDMEDIVNRCVGQIIRSGSSSSSNSLHNQNVITLGYRKKAAHSDASIRNQLDIECYYINTLHNYFLTSDWRKLVSIFGKKIPFASCLFSIFISFFQILNKVNQFFGSY
jgi:hypothetical protein